MKNKNLVIFDLDGVILDSKMNMEYAWSEVRRHLNIHTPFESYFKLIGRPFKDIIYQLNLIGRHDEIEKVYIDASKRALSEVSLYENAIDALFILEKMGKTLAVVTSKDEARTKIILENLPVKFSQVQTPNKKLRGKPAPDHLLYTLATLNFDPSEAVYIGDMCTDAEAAQRANIDYINAEWGYGDGAKEYKYTAANIMDIVKIFCT